MKKLFVLLFSLLLVACGGSDSDNTTIKVSCTAEPHATILEQAEPILKEKGYDLDIQILDNYFIFNKALDAGDVDANYFQHVPFFEGEVNEKGYDLVNAGGIHIEPFAFYSKTYTSIDQVTSDARVIISNSIADHGRLLTILEDNGLITLKDGVDSINATIDDIVDEKSVLKKANFEEINPELLTMTYNAGDGDLVAINGNYAISAGLNPLKDSLIIESAGSDNPYVNIVACKKGNENSDKVKVLVEVLKSDEIKNFITETYQGSVIPAE